MYRLGKIEIMSYFLPSISLSPEGFCVPPDYSALGFLYFLGVNFWLMAFASQ